MTSGKTRYWMLNGNRETKRAGLYNTNPKGFWDGARPGKRFQIFTDDKQASTLQYATQWDHYQPRK